MVGTAMHSSLEPGATAKGHGWIGVLIHTLTASTGCTPPATAASSSWPGFSAMPPQSVSCAARDVLLMPTHDSPPQCQMHALLPAQALSAL